MPRIWAYSTPTDHYRLDRPIGRTGGRPPICSTERSSSPTPRELGAPFFRLPFSVFHLPTFQPSPSSPREPPSVPSADRIDQFPNRMSMSDADYAPESLIPTIILPRYFPSSSFYLLFAPFAFFQRALSRCSWCFERFTRYFTRRTTTILIRVCGRKQERVCPKPSTSWHIVD